jgi:predicted NodU family carbamoyl transferase
MDLAASIQAVTEEIVLRMCRAIAKETGQRNLCLAGGVALNCVANGKLLRDGSFDNIWIQPAAGDAGGALGAALAVHYLMLDEKRTVDAAGNDMQGSYLGTHYTQAEIEERLMMKNLSTKLQVLWLAERPLDGTKAKWSLVHVHLATDPYSEIPETQKLKKYLT